MSDSASTLVPGDGEPLQLIADLAAISRIDAVQKILEVICHSTGMGFSAVARVTEYKNLFVGRQLLGLPLLEALPELRGQGFDDLLRRVLHTGQQVVGQETLVRLARTTNGPVEDHYFDFSYDQVQDPEGNPRGVYDHAVDLTDRVLARQALERSQGDLRQALAEREHLLESEQAARAGLEHAGRMKDEFLATLSHELRTPLNAIVGWIQILKTSGNNPEDLAERLAVIDRNARAQTQIIEDILDMSRIISGKLRLDVQKIDLAGIIRAGIDTVQPAADAKSVKLQTLLDPSAGPVSGDPNRLHQIFWNLLSNAVKFTQRGGKVRVLLERVNSHVEISVIDSGEGIDASFLPHVFDRFRQADASTTRRHGGLGLGLAIVKQLVELHGGSVRVKSPWKGQGSTFIVALPLTVIHAEQLEPVVVREHPESDAPLEHLPACGQLEDVEVVVVDDEPDGVAMIKRLLEECGAKVRTALSAGEASELIQKKVPTVLVSDIGIPDEDGYSLIRRVRSLPPALGGRLHAVALTAYA